MTDNISCAFDSVAAFASWSWLVSSAWMSTILCGEDGTDQPNETGDSCVSCHASEIGDFDGGGDSKCGRDEVVSRRSGAFACMKT